MECAVQLSLAGEAGGVNTLNTQSCFIVSVSFAKFDFSVREPHPGCTAEDCGGSKSAQLTGFAKRAHNVPYQKAYGGLPVPERQDCGTTASLSASCAGFLSPSADYACVGPSAGLSHVHTARARRGTGQPQGA